MRKSVEFGGRSVDPEGDAKRRERSNRARSSVESRLDRLCRNDDFAEWVYGILNDMVGLDNGITCVDDFVQGKRASASYIKQSLIGCASGAALIGRLTERYFRELRSQIPADKQS